MSICVCVFACLCVSAIALEPFKISSWNFCRSKIWSRAQISLKMAALWCTGGDLTLWRSRLSISYITMVMMPALSCYIATYSTHLLTVLMYYPPSNTYKLCTWRSICLFYWQLKKLILGLTSLKILIVAQPWRFEALRNALYKFKTYLLTYLQYELVTRIVWGYELVCTWIINTVVS